jgi:hypothetical protein
MNSISKEEPAGVRVIKLASVVALDSLNGGAELSGHIGKEISKSGICVRFKA